MKEKCGQNLEKTPLFQRAARVPGRYMNARAQPQQNGSHHRRASAGLLELQPRLHNVKLAKLCLTGVKQLLPGSLRILTASPEIP
jgi:hypothetical protein